MLIMLAEGIYKDAISEQQVLHTFNLMTDVDPSYAHTVYRLQVIGQVFVHIAHGEQVQPHAGKEICSSLHTHPQSKIVALPGRETPAQQS